MRKKIDVIECGVRHFSFCILILIFALVVVAFIGSADKGGANTGSFAVTDLNDNWTMELEGVTSVINLPSNVSAKKDSVIVIKNTLPSDIDGPYSLCARASVADLSVWINGVKREEYSSDSFENMGYYLPSAYVITELNKEDAGASIEIHITAKTAVTLNTVFLAPGNGVWFSIIKDNAMLNVIAIVVFVLGMIVLAIYFAGRIRLGKYKSVLYLGLVMLDMSMWMISESRLRQILFKRTSLTESFSYFTVEILGILVIAYFNEIQHRYYHKKYVMMQLLMAVQLLINIALNYTGVCELYRSLIFSHLWMGLGIVFVLGTIFMDLKKKRIKSYLVIAIGVSFFLLMACVELIAFYVSNFHSFGVYTCFGLIGLLLTTFIQIIHDDNKKHEEKEQEQAQSIISTIETITSAIDAKDEYTGGHSQRVGAYAQILAREMAADYDFSEEDILRIHYIGLVHDIGKIGVADPILNKPGRLTDEEFGLMKKHTDIGYDLMKALGDNMPGLVEGICKRQVKTSIFRQLISSTFRQLKTSIFYSLYISQGLLPGCFFI